MPMDAGPRPAVNAHGTHGDVGQRRGGNEISQIEKDEGEEREQDQRPATSAVGQTAQ